MLLLVTVPLDILPGLEPLDGQTPLNSIWNTQAEGGSPTTTTTTSSLTTTTYHHHSSHAARPAAAWWRMLHALFACLKNLSLGECFGQ